MRVLDVMQSQVITVLPQTTVPAAERLMREQGVRHLVVVDGEALLVGIVSARDLARARPSPATSLARHEVNGLLDRLTVEEIMTRPVIVVEPSRRLDEALRVMLMERISALPVTDVGRLVGILTDADVFDLVVRSMRAAGPSSRLEVTPGDELGTLAGVACTVEEVGAPIADLITPCGNGCASV
jgi:CBS domain-containing protein